MKIITPDYYKNFKCIAGACEDTCCAGWEVDVDEDSFRRYKNVTGDLGKRLADVMQPKDEGEGCTFRLTPDRRCPFLNEKNLCDIYTELGEEALCETCTYFPRFVHDYGAVREIGPAPSCFTAAQLMVNKRGKTVLESREDLSVLVSPNDIDPEAYFLLKDLREEMFEILWDEGLRLHKRLVRLLDAARAAEPELCGLLGKGTAGICKCDLPDTDDFISMWLRPFPGMEIINSDWEALLREHEAFCRGLSSAADKENACRKMEKECPFAEGAFTQLIFYYLFRYVLEAVHDGRLVCAVKTGLAAYLTVRRLCAARFVKSGQLTKDEMADIFHLYSRQAEHSDINFEYYRDAYDSKPEYRDEVFKFYCLTH